MSNKEKLASGDMGSAAPFILAVGVVAVSFAAIFIRLSSAPPLAIAFYRMFFATAFLVPVLFLSPGKRSEFGKLNLRLLSLIVLSGFLLSLHFAVWVSSLSHTSVASSVVLVATQPIFTAIFEHFFKKKRVSPGLVAGIMVAAGGSFLIGYGDFLASDLHWYGDLLALAGAIMAAGYFFVGRQVRQEIKTYPYVLLVYATSSIFLGVFSLGAGVRLGPFSNYNYVMFLLLALIPTIVGHTCFNWALEKFRASRVVTTVLGEPVGASILAAVLFREIPGPLPILGGCLTLTGILFVWREKSTSST